MRVLRSVAVALLLPSTSIALWCYETLCIDEKDDPPCVTADAAVTRPRNCGHRGFNQLPAPEGGGSYDRCLRTQASGAVDYTTPADDGISYYACLIAYACARSGSSGGYSCDIGESAWGGDGVLIANTTNVTNATNFNGAVGLVKMSRWCCSTELCNEPTQAKADRLANEAAVLAAAYTAEPTLGFEYEQSPTWTPGSCSMAAVGAAEGMYVPIGDLGFDVGEVGKCKPFNTRGLLEEILSFYIGDGQAKTMGWAFVAHCVECNTMPGDGRSPLAAQEGRTAAKHYFYASRDCDKLTLLYMQEYTLGRSASSCSASPSLDGTGYIARCGDPSFDTCPKPPQDGFTIMEFPDSSCRVPTNRLVAWNATQASQCVSDFSTRPDFIPSTVHSAKVCCTAATATLQYYSDGGCSTPHEAELGVVLDLRACGRRESLSPMGHLIATCSITQQDCSPLERQEEDEGRIVRREVLSEPVPTVGDESGDPTVATIAASAIAVALFGLLCLTKNKWMSAAQQAKLIELLHGSRVTAVTNRPRATREMTEKEKIFEVYRTVSFKDGDKPHTDHVTTARTPVLPGATNSDDDVEDPLQAIQLATDATVERNSKRRSQPYQDTASNVDAGGSHRERKSSIRSSSYRSKVEAGGSGRERKSSIRSSSYRSKVEAGGSDREHKSSIRSGSYSHRHHKEPVRLGSQSQQSMGTDRAKDSESSGRLRSKSMRADRVKDSDRIRSKSMRSDRTKHSDRSKSQSMRQDRVKDSDGLRSGSTGSAKDRTRTTEQLRSNSEGKRRSAMHSSKLKSLEGSTTLVTPANRRLKKAASTVVAARKLFDRIDVDGSGTLERDELAMLALKMGKGLTAEELDAAMAAMDKDGNGTVDFDEFYTWYNGSSRAMGKAEVKVLAYFQRSADT